MKRIVNILAAIVLLTIATTNKISAQPVKPSATDSARTWLQQHTSAISISSYQQFIKQLRPALKTMGAMEIVGLGEGTHGTSEFQTVRAYITRYLCTEKGFNIVCLENSYGWCEELNKYIQTGQGNLDTLMKKNLLGMWQNTEIRSMLQWMQTYNQSHKSKLKITGMDYSESGTNIRLLKPLVHKLNQPALDIIMDTLLRRAAYMDSAYSDFNNAKPAFKWKDILDNGVKGYEEVVGMKKILDSTKQEWAARLSGEETKTLHRGLYNYNQAFYSIYKPVKENEDASRDEIMANMVKHIKDDNEGAKIIVWAHNAHMAKGKVFGDDNNGGGSGSFLDKFYPNKYYAFGTATAGGSFSATTDRFILSTSPFKVYPLNEAKEGSWERVMSSIGKGACFIDAQDKKAILPLLPFRFTGYSPTQKGDFVDAKINSLFDGVLFIPVTQSTHIAQ